MNLSHSPTEHESDIARRAKSGDEDAFVELVGEFQEGIRRSITRYLGDAHVADDLAQDVFMAAYRQIQDLENPERIRPWLFMIARNKAMTYLRKEVTGHKVKGELLEAKLTQWRIDNFQTHVGDDLIEEQHLALRDCLQEISQSNRQMIEQFYYEKQTAETIAKNAGRKSGSVRMMLMRIRQSLGKCIRQKLEKES